MQNTLFTNDNLFILNGMNSESVDLIYLDPPFNSKRIYSAPIGSKAAGTSFKDMWTWEDVNEAYLDKLVDKYPMLVDFIKSIQITHSKAMMAYITYMTQRLIEMQRILKDTGSIYLHCDPTASHYLKIVLDAIFGKNNFRNEITWKRTSAHSDASKKFARLKDCILYYSKSNNYHYSQQYVEYTDDYIKSAYRYKDDIGVYKLLNPTGPNVNPKDPEWDGRHPARIGRHWSVNKSTLEKFATKEELKKMNTLEKLELMNKHGCIVRTKTGGVQFKKYLDTAKGVLVGDIWNDIYPAVSKERTGYPTQKPLALLERIIKTSSKEGDIVFDPFCGSATTCIAAQRLNRKWIGIDIEEKAVEILIDRLEKDGYMDDTLKFKQYGQDFINRTDIPQRTDVVIVPETDKSVKERLFKEQQGRCNACNVEMQIIHFEVDHIIPKSKGGGDYYENYQLLCSSCNRIKGDRPMEYLRIKIEQREELMKKIKFGEK